MPQDYNIHAYNQTFINWKLTGKSTLTGGAAETGFEGRSDGEELLGDNTSYGKSNGNYSGADNIADAARSKEYYRQAEKYGTGSIKELQNGRFRFYEELKPARIQGEMAEARHIREWNPHTGYKRD